MFKYLIPICVIFAVVLTANCEEDVSFENELFERVTQNKWDENVIISPASIRIALSLGYFGTGGNTAEELAKALRFNELEKPEIGKKIVNSLQHIWNSNATLSIANKLWVNADYEIRPEFQEIALGTFKSEAEVTDFSDSVKVTKDINDWIESKTNNKIKNVIVPSSIQESTRVVLVNAIYFKGAWLWQFGPHRTRKAEFWTTPTTSEPVDTMILTKPFGFGHFRDLNASCIELPYADSDLSMMIILPKQRDGLQDVEERLKRVDLLELSKKMHSRSIQIHLPKFHAELSIDLKDILQKMGINEIFHSSADFSGIFKSKVDGAKISEIRHKTFIDVDEYGSEAAAATYAQIMKVSGHPETKQIKVNHPFVFAIKDKEQIYFMGHIVKP